MNKWSCFCKEKQDKKNKLNLSTCAFWFFDLISFLSFIFLLRQLKNKQNCLCLCKLFYSHSSWSLNIRHPSCLNILDLKVDTGMADGFEGDFLTICDNTCDGGQIWSLSGLTGGQAGDWRRVVVNVKCHAKNRFFFSSARNPTTFIVYTFINCQTI